MLVNLCQLCEHRNQRSNWHRKCVFYLPSAVAQSCKRSQITGRGQGIGHVYKTQQVPKPLSRMKLGNYS